MVTKRIFVDVSDVHFTFCFYVKYDEYLVSFEIISDDKNNDTNDVFKKFKDFRCSVKDVFDLIQPLVDVGCSKWQIHHILVMIKAKQSGELPVKIDKLVHLPKGFVRREI
jgi:hypothetical protein